MEQKDKTIEVIPYNKQKTNSKKNNIKDNDLDSKHHQALIDRIENTTIEREKSAK